MAVLKIQEWKTKGEDGFFTSLLKLLDYFDCKTVFNVNEINCAGALIVGAHGQKEIACK